jgi:hypothetical protein
MSNTIHALAQQLMGKALVEECSIEEVQQIAQRYPYFAPAQFLLVQKLKQIDSPDLESQKRKAVLFFPDPILFDYFISSDNFYSDDVVVENKADSQPLVDYQNKILNNNTDEESNKESIIADDFIEKVVDIEAKTTHNETERQDVSFLHTDLLEEQIVEEEISNDSFSDTLQEEKLMAKLPAITKIAVANIFKFIGCTLPEGLIVL